MLEIKEIEYEGYDTVIFTIQDEKEMICNDVIIREYKVKVSKSMLQDLLEELNAPFIGDC